MNIDALYCAHCQNDDHATYACEARDTVTDAEVEAAAEEVAAVGNGNGPYDDSTLARAALEAAREVRNAAH